MKLNSRRNRQAGFSLIELLIVVAIILVLAALAVPSLMAAKQSANEGSAVASLEQLQKSMVQYQSVYPLGLAAPGSTTPLFTGLSIPDLGYGTAGSAATCATGPSTNTAACLVLDPALNTASTTPAGFGPKAGFVFNLTTISPDGSQWIFNAQPNSASTGRKCFQIDQTGLLQTAPFTVSGGTGTCNGPYSSTGN